MQSTEIGGRLVNVMCLFICIVIIIIMWDLLGPRVRYYLIFMAISTSNLCVPLQERC